MKSNVQESGLENASFQAASHLVLPGPPEGADTTATHHRRSRAARGTHDHPLGQFRSVASPPLEDPPGKSLKNIEDPISKIS